MEQGLLCDSWTLPFMLWIFFSQEFINEMFWNFHVQSYPFLFQFKWYPIFSKILICPNLKIKSSYFDYSFVIIHKILFWMIQSSVGFFMAMFLMVILLFTGSEVHYQCKCILFGNLSRIKQTTSMVPIHTIIKRRPKIPKMT